MDNAPLRPKANQAILAIALLRSIGPWPTVYLLYVRNIPGLLLTTQRYALMFPHSDAAYAYHRTSVDIEGDELTKSIVAYLKSRNTAFPISLVPQAHHYLSQHLYPSWTCYCSHTLHGPTSLGKQCGKQFRGDEHDKRAFVRHVLDEHVSLTLLMKESGPWKCRRWQGACRRGFEREEELRAHIVGHHV